MVSLVNTESVPPVTPIRVVIADDHTIVREGLRALLSAEEDMQVVGEASDGADALQEVLRTKPDVVVMDLGMPRLNGVEATQQIRNHQPDTQVVVLSMHSGEEFVRPAIRAGAAGYLVKGSGLSDLVAAIRAVRRGEAFFSPSVAKLVLDRSALLAESPRPDELTNREREVLQLIAEGNSSADVARILTLSVKTVESHRSHIMDKLGVRNVAGLVRHAVRLGLVRPDAS